MRTRIALAGAALAVGAIFGITGGGQALAYPCTGGGCGSLVPECGSEQCVANGGQGKLD